MVQKNLPIALALDTGSEKKAKEWIDFFSDWVACFKVGPVLFNSWPGVIDYIKEKERMVFLDLKLHDIPNTVFLAFESLSKRDVDFITIHMSGGKEMVQAAVDGGRDVVDPIGVGVLTSISSGNWESFSGKSIKDSFSQMLSWSWDSGLKNFVSSGSEVEFIKSSFPDCSLWVPGVRFSGDFLDDQKRVTTPKDAIEKGANWLVIGRALLGVPHKEAVQKMKIFQREIGA